MLLEPSRTNIWTNSNLFGSITLDGLTRTLNQSVSPSGDSDATLFNETATTGTHRFYRLDIPSTSTDFSMSFFAKKNGINIIRIVAQGGTKYADFDLSVGTVGNESGINSSAIEDYGNGWYRCVINVTATGWVGLYALNDSSQNSYLGNVSKGVYLYGASLEQGSYATSYIPTQGSAVTRLADSCSQTVPDGVIGQTEGTMFVDVDFDTLSDLNMFLSIRPNSSNKIEIYRDGNIIYAETASSNSFDISKTNITVGRHKIAFAYSSGSSAMYINGVLIGSDTKTFAFTSTLDDIYINSRGTSFIEQSNYNEVKIYNTRLSNAELITLTT